MELFLWTSVLILSAVVLSLFLQNRTLITAAWEIAEGFADRLRTDTNTTIGISSSHPAMCKLAAEVNRQLQELRRQRRRYEQGDRELKEAVTNISHDLRTPLTAICGYLDLLEQEQNLEEICRVLDIIRNRTNMLRQLTEELFRYSVMLTTEEGLIREPVVLNNLLEQSIGAFYTTLTRKGITPVIHMPEQKVIRSLDAAALSRVFGNLLQNAAKYSDGDLEIILTPAGEITFANKATQLNDVLVGKLFDRFYTVETAVQSTGLGLSIARSLVERMNGSIAARYEQERLILTLNFPDFHGPGGVWLWDEPVHSVIRSESK